MLVHARGRRHAALDALPQQGGAVTDRLHVVHRQVCQEEKEILVHISFVTVTLLTVTIRI